jgi:hypothetical protein
MRARAASSSRDIAIVAIDERAARFDVSVVRQVIARTIDAGAARPKGDRARHPHHDPTTQEDDDNLAHSSRAGTLWWLRNSSIRRCSGPSRLHPLPRSSVPPPGRSRQRTDRSEAVARQGGSPGRRFGRSFRAMPVKPYESEMALRRRRRTDSTRYCWGRLPSANASADGRVLPSDAQVLLAGRSR